MSAAGDAREFRVIYGFTRENGRADLRTLEFTGILRVSPEGIGIYRTGDLLHPLGGGGLETLAWPETDISPGTDATPEHIIPPDATTVVYDADRRAVVLKVPGATHVVLKLPGALIGGSKDLEHEMLDCLAARTGAPTVAQDRMPRPEDLLSRRVSRVALAALVIILAVLIVVVLFLIQRS